MAPPDPEPLAQRPQKHSDRRQEVRADPLEPTTSGALLAQSFLRLHAPHNALVLDRCVRCIQILSTY